MILTSSEIGDSVFMALGSIRTNKFRSFLTMLGVMVGVGSVIALASIIDGLALAVDNEINNFGSNVIYITKFAPDQDFEHISEEDRNRDPITEGEAKAILADCPSVDGIAPQDYVRVRGGNKVKYKNRKFDRPTIFGTWPDYLKVRNREITEGRFISPSEQQFRLRVCVVGSDITKTLFEGETAVGKEIRVNGEMFTVIGVLKETKSNLGNDSENNVVVMPLSTFMKIYPWEEELLLIARANSYKNIEQAKEEITASLRRFRKVPFNKGNSFALTTQDSIREQTDKITGGIYLAMLVVTSVGLMVGGIGVMNIMLVSVTERTREIGVRKAIGAKRINIILQFLTEATTLSGVGGLIGILIGLIIGLAVSSVLGLPPTISILWVFIGFFVSVSVGLVSGIYPAVKAARLDPIEALRYE